MGKSPDRKKRLEDAHMHLIERISKMQSQRQQGQNLSDKAYRIIKNSIITCELEPGSYLSENMLAEALEMSRTPIREAIKLLQEENLLTAEKSQGIYVSDISLSDVKQLYATREALECKALDLARDSLDKKRFDELKNQLEEYLIKLKRGEELDYEVMAASDRKFHMAIIEESENDYIKNFMNNIYAQISRYQYLSARAHSDIEDSIYQHLQLIELIQNESFAETIKKLKIHIDKAAQNIIYGIFH
ncbi:GntR family transcriptional regulator [Halarsenatibacter silvermanii]|uniref:DNA-binding transcriptional regulator, GntR family n=1 Tax=Halarsenatibacter silvermanii TaxID=321763 RepID=A0A1G9ST78_9FIRM|nr:GntR family transcriptional regulator [Halarsenatibacter silvermanii]SDM38564.1 DNA-binding transcriptional regulator, GntR family [Halarsenatibacter silvermanii]